MNNWRVAMSTSDAVSLFDAYAAFRARLVNLTGLYTDALPRTIADMRDRYWYLATSAEGESELRAWDSPDHINYGYDHAWKVTDRVFPEGIRRLDNVCLAVCEDHRGEALLVVLTGDTEWK